MVRQITMNIAYITDVGLVREDNEDSHYVDEELGLLIVADGIGGHQAGEVASQMAVEIIPLMLKMVLEKKDQIQKHILEAMYKANEEILAAADDPSLKGMGTTVVLALCKGDEIYIAHVGDSRAYLVRQNKMEQVTEDHSVVCQLLKAGKITREEARNHHLGHIITQAIGSQSYISPDINSFTWSEGDYLLLCSDGLTDLVEDEKIEGIILMEDGDLDAKCGRLVELAKRQGGKDNITVILACNEWGAETLLRSKRYDD